MEGALKRSLGSQVQHTHTLWKHIHGLSNKAPPHTLNTFITFNNKIATTPKHTANCFTKQFTNTVKHATHKTNRHINRATHNIQGYNITLTTSHVQEAIKQSKNNNSQGPDKLNIKHLKHIGPLGLAFLTCMFKTALNKNKILHTWKLVNIVPIPKPNKDTDKGTSYRPISLLRCVYRRRCNEWLQGKDKVAPLNKLQRYPNYNSAFWRELFFLYAKVFHGSYAIADDNYYSR